MCPIYVHVISWSLRRLVLIAMYHDAKRENTRTKSSVGSDGELWAPPSAGERHKAISLVTRPDRQNGTTKNRHSASAPVSPPSQPPACKRTRSLSPLPSRASQAVFPSRVPTSPVPCAVPRGRLTSMFWRRSPPGTDMLGRRSTMWEALTVGCVW